MSRLILIRHGQSQWNLENRFTGFKDVPLTELGETEARECGEKLLAAGFHPKEVFTSTLQRAWRTAELVLETSGLKIPMIKSDDLRERNYGDLAGLNKAETAEKFGIEQVQLWRRSYEVQPPGGESLRDVVARVAPYYVKNIAPLLNKGQDILIVSHINTLRALLITLGLNTPENIQSAEIPNGVPLFVEFQDGVASTSRYL